MNDQSRSLASTLFPVGLLLIAMASIQSGASLAKSMFPIVGAQGTTTLRLIFASIIMLLLLRPWRAKLTAKSLRTVIVYGMALGGMNFLFYMSLRSVPWGSPSPWNSPARLPWPFMLREKPSTFSGSFWLLSACCC